MFVCMDWCGGVKLKFRKLDPLQGEDRLRSRFPSAPAALTISEKGVGGTNPETMEGT